MVGLEANAQKPSEGAPFYNVVSAPGCITCDKRVYHKQTIHLCARRFPVRDIVRRMANRWNCHSGPWTIRALQYSPWRRHLTASVVWWLLSAGAPVGTL